MLNDIERELLEDLSGLSDADKQRFIRTLSTLQSVCELAPAQLAVAV